MVSFKLKIDSISKIDSTPLYAIINIITIIKLYYMPCAQDLG